MVVMPGGLRLPGALLYLQIVEDEEEGLSGQALVELHGVRVWGWHLVVVGGRRAGVPGEVLPVGIESISACPCRLKGGQKATPCLPTASLPLMGQCELLGHLITPTFNSSAPTYCGEAQVKWPASVI